MLQKKNINIVNTMIKKWIEGVPSVGTPSTLTLQILEWENKRKGGHKKKHIKKKEKEWKNQD